jgi:hypothetical protein
VTSSPTRDARGDLRSSCYRPYFLWDCDLTDAQFRALLVDADRDVRAYAIGKLMRQAKPDDVFQYIDLDTILAHWDGIQRNLGRTRAFWNWIVPRWVEVRGRRQTETMPPSRQ